MSQTGDRDALRKRIRRHVTGREHRFFAAVHPGFESIAADEIRETGVDPAPRPLAGGVEFSGKLEACYRANIRCRTVTRVLMRLAEFRVRRFAKLRELAGEIPWELYLDAGTPVAFSTAAHGSRLFHTARIETEFRRAITARLGAEPFPAEAVFAGRGAAPDIVHTVFIRLDGDLCTVSLDSTGEPLYRRGHKLHVEEAPLRETLAAALLLAAGIGKCDAVIDPMAGAGTFSLEAGLIALNIPPGLGRRFAFETWPAYSAAARNHMVKLLAGKVRPAAESPLRILCSDISGKSVATERANMERAGLAEIVQPRQADFFSADFELPAVAALITLNPPYGRRLGEVPEALKLYTKIGERLRSAFPRAGFVIIAPGKRFEKSLGVEYDERIPFSHGGVAVAALIRHPRA